MKGFDSLLFFLNWLNFDEVGDDDGVVASVVGEGGGDAAGHHGSSTER